MQAANQSRLEQDSTNGIGKLTKSLGIVKEDYGRVMFEYPLFIAEGKEIGSIAVGPRIGIHNSGDAVHYPWRFWVQDNRFVSK